MNMCKWCNASILMEPKKDNAQLPMYMPTAPVHHVFHISTDISEDTWSTQSWNDIKFS
jgi:hypothetical protein